MITKRHQTLLARRCRIRAVGRPQALGLRQDPPRNREARFVRILFGPPGTGKTWRAAALAVSIVDGKAESEEVDRDRFNRLRFDPHSGRYGQRVPTLGVPSSLRGVVDLYDASDDWIPIYDKSRVPGFYMAVGTSGNQLRQCRSRRSVRSSITAPLNPSGP